ncbi:MAG: sensor histidine kinase [Pirellulales bacterium]
MTIPSQSAKTTVTTARTAKPSRWQLLVVPSATTTGTKINTHRIDSAHPLGGPHMQLGWIQQVGWHSPLASDPAAAAISITNLAQSSVGHAEHPRVKAPKFLINSHRVSKQPEIVETAELDKRLIELAIQLATDIRGPLAAAHRIVSELSHQVRFNSFLSVDDADRLAGASNKLDLIAQWTDSILLTRKVDADGVEIIRSRFTPVQWMHSVRELLEKIALPKRIQIEWIGWDAELPCLYLDPNHLTRAVVNLIANAAAASELGGKIIIRANWQNNVTQRLMITIEDNGLGLPANLMKMLNSSTVENLLPTKGIGLQSARQLITSIGGLIAAQHGTNGGTIVRVSLPVDTYPSMIRAWMLQNATLAPNNATYRVSLFAVRSTLSECDAFNVHLQRAATSKQFVYRVAENRWLILELKAAHERSDSTIMAAAERFVPMRLQDSQPWLSQSVFNSQDFILDGLLGRTDGTLRLPQLTEQVAAKFAELLNHKKPAIDTLTINGAEIPAPHIARRIPTLEFQSVSSNELPTQSNAADHVQADFATRSQAASSQQVSAQPGVGTVSEIVKQWKMVQAKLALNSSSASR